MCSSSTCVKTHITFFLTNANFTHTNYVGDNVMRVEMMSLKMGRKIFLPKEKEKWAEKIF